MSHKVLFVSVFVLFGTVLGVVIADAQGPRPGTRSPRANVGTAFTYQGQLKSGGALVNGNCEFGFRLYDASSSGAQIGSVISTTVPVTNGLFTAPLDFGANALNGDARWLDIQVRCGGGAFTTLTRQALMPAPMALALPGLYTQQNATSPNLIGGYSGNVISPTVVGGTISGGGASGGENKVWANYATVSGGQGNTASGAYATVGGGYFNTTGGFSATISGGKMNTAFGAYATIGGGFANTAFGDTSSIGGGYNNRAPGAGATVGGGSNNIASSNNTTIGGGEINYASNWYATVGGGMYNTASGISAFVGGGGHNGTTWNGNKANATASTIGGGYGNVISATGEYGFIGGGENNTASGDRATVGGGWRNTASGNHAFVGGGSWNTANLSSATVSGGYLNSASGVYATVGGGIYNTASGIGSFVGGGGHDGIFLDAGNRANAPASTIGGGFGNVISSTGLYAFIGGGAANTASGYYATIPGGIYNSATMTLTFAAGRRAKANHQGTFVWADSTDADFASTGNNQFLIRASGGVGINGASFVTTTNALQVDKGNIMVRGINNFAGMNEQAILYLGDTSQYIKSVYGAGMRIGTYGAADAITLQEFSGNVGIGTVGGSDKLTVLGDLRVGTSGTNGCVKRFDGTAIAGSCSSDARLKQNIAAFPSMIEQVSQLQPVHYSWRADEFPQYGFSANTQSYGLIAQEVERVLPELVGQDEFGFKTVNYSELPLVLLQALKELRAEKDAEVAGLKSQVTGLVQQNAALEARLTALEQKAGTRSTSAPFDLNVFPFAVLLIGAVILYRSRKDGAR